MNELVAVCGLMDFYTSAELLIFNSGEPIYSLDLKMFEWDPFILKLCSCKPWNERKSDSLLDYDSPPPPIPAILNIMNRLGNIQPSRKGYIALLPLRLSPGGPRHHFSASFCFVFFLKLLSVLPRGMRAGAAFSTGSDAWLPPTCAVPPAPVDRAPTRGVPLANTPTRPPSPL